RLRELAVLVPRHLGLRAGDLLFAILLALGDAFDDDDEAPRRPLGPGLAVREARLVERGRQRGGQVVEGRVEEARGELLGTDLEKQVSHGHRPQREQLRTRRYQGGAEKE